ncbi:conserved hypothetical protein, partial [sediment metagenome]
MSTIQNLFQQAQLAEAAYADFGKFASPKDALIDNSFSDTQATAFLADWSVISQQPDTENGFSATLFKNKSGTYSLAIRGSTPAQGMLDFIDDTKLIASDGIAVKQVVDLYNYWQSLTHTGAYPVAKLTTMTVESAILTLYGGSWASIPRSALNYVLGTDFSYDPLSVPSDVARAFFTAAGYIVDNGMVYKLEPDTSINIYSDSRRLGTSVPSLSSVTVDGHSLGGHLAMAFSRLFPNATNSVTAVNGLGFKIGNANVDNLFSAFGDLPSSPNSVGTAFDAGKIQNVYGIAGAEFAAMNNGILQQPGGWDGIYIESAILPVGVALGHGAGQMTDSLALYNLLATLDPSLNTATPDNLTKLTGFLKASSYVAANSLEYTLDALRTLLQTDYTLGSANRVALPATAIDDRESLYANLQSLQVYLAGSAFNLNTGDTQLPQYAFTLHTLQEAAGSKGLAEAAKADLATRYALYQGNTFVLDSKCYQTDLYGTINSNGAL